MNFFIKIAKKGVFLSTGPRLTWQPGPGDQLTWQGGDVARGTTAPLRRGTEATRRTRVAHAGRAYGADVWPGATRTPVRGATWRGGLVSGGPTG